MRDGRQLVFSSIIGCYRSLSGVRTINAEGVYLFNPEYSVRLASPAQQELLVV